MVESFAIRVHGRGGQGGVTCAKLLASVYAKLGFSAQTFGDYAGERSGAPVRAYTRVSDEPITNRNKVYEPDQLLVLDPSLLDETTLVGLPSGGTLLLNTPDGPEALGAETLPFRVATVDATEIARRHGIGTRSMVIVNTTIAGAYAKMQGVSLEVLEEAYKDLGLEGNFPAAREAYEAVVVREANGQQLPKPAAPAGLPEVAPVTELVSSPHTGLKTGSWSSQRPAYVTKLAPCNAWCPAGNDVVGFMQALAKDGAEAAAKILARSSPLPGVCGRVCPAPCMTGCNRVQHDGAVNIRAMERWISDHAPVPELKIQKVKGAKKVAVIGGGPAGISAAYHLALLGHEATIIEGEKELGGVLRTGIPVYRLPRAVLDREIEGVLALGVEARLGEFVNKDALVALESDFDAVIISTGLQQLRSLDVDGAELEGVEQGIVFLHRINLEERPEVKGHVVVLGGGNTAMDCARSALRAGADKVTVAYRRTDQEMPAIKEEIEEAKEEGIEFLFLRQPVAFFGKDRVEGIELAECELGEPDGSGRRRPVVTERTSKFECTTVLLALGQGANLTLLPDGWELNEAEARIYTGGQPLNVFGAGDVATWEGTVTHALGHGRRAAGRALQALGVEVEVFEPEDKSKASPASDVRFEHFGTKAPGEEGHQPEDARVKNWDEVNQGMADPSEAERCFSCGHCTLCDTCLVYCPEGIVSRVRLGYAVDGDYCKGCGICVEECPRTAMEMRAQ